MFTIEELKSLAKGIKVLYVEDNEIARKKTYKILSRIFDNIDVAVHGGEGVSTYMTKRHDLVISDIIMNVMNGIEMAKIIKNVNSEQNIIFLSAYTEQKFLINAIEIGVDGFVFKPLDYDNLYNVIYKSLKQISLKKQNLEYKNNLEKLVEERSKDLIAKNKELKEMIKEVKKSNALKEEMKLAQKVQNNFLPKSIPQSQKIKIATFFEPAQYVGADYYDFFYSSDNSINIVIADVSGHGIAPAITMSTFRGVCKTVFSLNISLKEQVELINDLMYEDTKSNEFFITAFFIKYNEKDNEFEYISAGHNEMLHFNCMDKYLYELESTAIPLAIFPQTKYTSIKKTISKNDFFVLYTDGLTEATNSSNEMFSLDRLKEVILKSKKLHSDEILLTIQSSLNDFIKDESKKDDTTVLVIKLV